jgi:hypothetical protein
VVFRSTCVFRNILNIPKQEGINLFFNTFFNIFLRSNLMFRKLFFVACFCMFLTAPLYAQDLGLVGWWKFDETSGTVASDSSGNGNNGTLNGGITRVAGRLGGALDLDGVNGYVDCGNAAIFDLTDQVTLAVWVNTRDMGNGQHNPYITKGDHSYAIKGHQWGSIEFYIYSGGWRTCTMPAGASFNGEWHHLAGTFDGTQLLLYLDGEQQSRTPFTGAIDTRTFNVNIGRNDENQDRLYEGLIDDARIYNRALSAAEIKKLANPEKASEPSPANGDILNQSEVTLSWNAGENATVHNVYFSDDLQAVTDGNAPMETISQTSYGPLSLDLGTTYYWRVDEVQDDGSVYAGDVWSFTAQPIKAYGPTPADDAKYVDTDIILSWNQGFGAASHDVYFGTDENAVADANNASPEFLSNQDALTYQLPALEFDTTYYWRVDELGDDMTVTKGDVWTFGTIPELVITDPTLVGYWKLDDGGGDIALDWSGYNNHGVVVGNPQWITGQLDGALYLDGYDDCVDLSDPESLNIADAVSLLAWIKPESLGNGADQTFISKGQESYALKQASNNTLEFRISDTINVQATIDSSLNGDWHHVAGTYDGSSLNVYLDGVFQGTTSSVGTVNASAYNVNIGRESVGNRFHYNGGIDDVRIYTRALTEDEIIEAMREDLLIAWSPSPSNGAVMDIKHTQPLTWLPGDNASQHDVYFGMDMDAVAGADTSTPEIYKGRQASASYTPTGLEWGQSYFWRIDEVNSDGTVSTGKIWSFTIADYLVVDDFEDYNDYPPNEIWSTWIDGYDNPANGSTAGYPDPDFNAGEHYVETTIVHGGAQSFPLFYDNAVGISEATRNLTTLRDWTQYDVDTLTIWYYGDAANAVVPMYAALNGNAVVTTDNASAVTVLEWTQWDIPLQAFADQNVNLAAVNSITLGFGNKANPTAGGSGVVYFDDIRLYSSEPDAQ